MPLSVDEPDLRLSERLTQTWLQLQELPSDKPTSDMGVQFDDLLALRTKPVNAAQARH